MAKKRTLSIIEAEIKANITAFNTAVGNEDFTAMAAANKTQETLEKEYASLAEKVCYDNLKKLDKPMLEAIKTYGYDVVKHKDVNVTEKTVVDGEEVEVSYVRREMTVKEKQIDLIKFDNYGGKTVSVDAMWKYEMQTVNQLFCIRTAQDMGIKFTPQSYFMDKMARRIEDGETPVSNTAMLEAVQKLVDMVVYEKQEDKDSNKYRVNSRDITYILKVYTKPGKGRLEIATAKHNYFASVIGKVLYRIMTGEQYSLGYKMSKDN